MDEKRFEVFTMIIISLLTLGLLAAVGGLWYAVLMG